MSVMVFRIRGKGNWSELMGREWNLVKNIIKNKTNKTTKKQKNSERTVCPLEFR